MANAAADPEPDRHTGTNAPARRWRLGRPFWLVLGWVMVAIAIIGLFVPLLPTTDFLLLALPCFARSSPRLEAWLLDHPRFGPPLQAWRRERAIPTHAKLAACGGMALGYALFWWLARPGWIAAIAIAAVMLLAAAWILSRPVPRG
ncbi:YbaN family protein [Sphingomonas immobilis]|uniref:YbaN family protein n=1 Tax=Sphingomonas immobilis TaxID=3063997 RepID=A0ABT9A4B1_9SPHN|nr:YbaN family protein [Sphingomonas sp. CA1-15]MDO7843801.1 YbaN family protein [Sphingomonas sp. CA1-15]